MFGDAAAYVMLLEGAVLCGGLLCYSTAVLPDDDP